MAWAANMTLLAYGTTDGAIVVVDVPTGTVKHRCTDLKPPISLSLDGTRLLAAKGQNKLIIRMLADGSDVASIPCADVSALFMPAISPDGRCVILSTNDPAVGWMLDVWSLEAKSCQHLELRASNRMSYSETGS